VDAHAELAERSKGWRVASWVLAIAIAGGCGGPAAEQARPEAPSARAAPAPVESMIAAYDRFATLACACEDRACVGAQTETYDKASADAARAMSEGDARRLSDDPRTAKIAARLTDCTAKLAKASRGPRPIRSRTRAGAQAEYQQMMSSYAAFVDEVCACNDQACVAHATERFGRDNAELARDMSPEAAKRMAEDPRMMDLTKQMTKCATRMAEEAAKASP
jgi:hypothetical protein